MSKDVTKILGELGNIPSEMKKELVDLWNDNLVEARKDAAAELREEFARKHEHDKKIVVQAMEKFMEDHIDSELKTVAEQRKELDTIKVTLVKESALAREAFNQYLVGKLKTEITELHDDRKRVSENFGKMEKFILENLTSEIASFREDKRLLDEQKQKIIAEGKAELEATKAKFVKRAAAQGTKLMNTVLSRNIKQLSEDIKASRENAFGRKLFEAFASEYVTSHLNENSELNDLKLSVEAMKSQIAEHDKVITDKDKILEGMDIKLKAAKDRLVRDKKLSSLLQPLNESKRDMMSHLLESVKTRDLDAMFDQYLPAILEGKNVPHNKKLVTEGKGSKVVTGNRGTTPRNTTADDKEMMDIRRLAGIDKKG